MNLSLDELETIKKKSFQEGYDEGHKIGFEKGYAQGMDYSDSCLEARIEELEEDLDKLKTDMRGEDEPIQRKLNGCRRGSCKDCEDKDTCKFSPYEGYRKYPGFERVENARKLQENKYEMGNKA